MFNKSQLFFIYKTKSVNLFQEMTVVFPYYPNYPNYPKYPKYPNLSTISHLPSLTGTKKRA